MAEKTISLILGLQLLITCQIQYFFISKVYINKKGVVGVTQPLHIHGPH